MVCIGEFADKLGINTPPKNVSWPCDTIRDYRPAPAHCCLWVTGTFAPLDSLYPHINRVFFFHKVKKETNKYDLWLPCGEDKRASVALP